MNSLPAFLAELIGDTALKAAKNKKIKGLAFGV